MFGVQMFGVQVFGEQMFCGQSCGQRPVDKACGQVGSYAQAADNPVDNGAVDKAVDNDKVINRLWTMLWITFEAARAKARPPAQAEQGCGAF